MQVDPILKQDLKLVKEAFENGAQKQSGNAVFVPFRPMISSTRQVHENVRAAVARYPSVYVKSSSKQSLIDTIQQQCIPCASRLKVLRNLDISPDLDLMLGNYNTRSLKNLIKFFGGLKGRTPIEQNICGAFAAMRSNCVPDLQRLIQALTLILTDIRSIDLKTLNVSFLSVVISLISKITVNYTTGFDKYTRLITDTLRCMASDLKTQLAKLDPILSAGGRANTEEAFKNAWKKNEEGKNWVQNNAASRPVYNSYAFGKIDKASQSSVESVDKVGKATEDFTLAVENKTGDVVAVLSGVINLAIGRVEANLDGAIQDLMKMLKANDQNLNAMNTLIQQIQSIIGTISLLQALVSSNARQQYDACGPDRGRKFFNDLTIPNRKIYLVPPPPDSGRPPNDIDIVIADNPIQVDNPIIRGVLEQAGVAIKAVNTGTTGNVNAEDLHFVVDSEPLSINFFACMKKTLGQ